MRTLTLHCFCSGAVEEPKPYIHDVEKDGEDKFGQPIHRESASRTDESVSKSSFA